MEAAQWYLYLAVDQMEDHLVVGIIKLAQKKGRRYMITYLILFNIFATPTKVWHSEDAALVPYIWVPINHEASTSFTGPPVGTNAFIVLAGRHHIR